MRHQQRPLFVQRAASLVTAIGFTFTIAASSMGLATTSATVIDDAGIKKSLLLELGKLVESKATTDGKVLAEQLSRKSCDVKLLTPGIKPVENIYDNCVDSVVAIGSVYKCGKCDNWHNSGAATAWVLTADGVMVTNYHVFAGKTVAGFGVVTREGRVAPVLEILAANKKTDVAIFRVEGDGYKPLALGPEAKVSTDLHIIAHPDSRFFTYTFGKVSRYYHKRVHHGVGTKVMAVTADFARGSSGGPALDSAGNVVGMVSSTQSIYYPPKKKTDKKGPFQMVIHNCVPVSAIRALVKDTEKK